MKRIRLIVLSIIMTLFLFSRDGICQFKPKSSNSMKSYLTSPVHEKTVKYFNKLNPTRKKKYEEYALDKATAVGTYLKNISDSNNPIKKREKARELITDLFFDNNIIITEYTLTSINETKSEYHLDEFLDIVYIAGDKGMSTELNDIHSKKPFDSNVLLKQIYAEQTNKVRRDSQQDDFIVDELIKSNKIMFVFLFYDEKLIYNEPEKGFLIKIGDISCEN